MKQYLVDVLLGIAGVALVAFLLHNTDSVKGTIATVTDIYRQGAKDIQG